MIACVKFHPDWNQIAFAEMNKSSTKKRGGAKINGKQQRYLMEMLGIPKKEKPDVDDSKMEDR